MRRRGLTLVEVIVALGIVAIALGLLAFAGFSRPPPVSNANALALVDEAFAATARELRLREAPGRLLVATTASNGQIALRGLIDLRDGTTAVVHTSVVPGPESVSGAGPNGPLPTLLWPEAAPRSWMVVPLTAKGEVLAEVVLTWTFPGDRVSSTVFRPTLAVEEAR